MTDVWLSVGKKYCEICKCWYYNNAISANRHQMGGRHKANVAKKLRELGQKSREASIAERERHSMLVQMEMGARAAMKAEEKSAAAKQAPVRRGYGAQTSSYGAQTSSYGAQTSSYGSFNPSYSGGPSGSNASNFAVWFEALTQDGHVYYWNCATQKTSWNAPKEGYVSIAAQMQQSASRRSSNTSVPSSSSSFSAAAPLPPPPPHPSALLVPSDSSVMKEERETEADLGGVGVGRDAPFMIDKPEPDTKPKPDEKPLPLGHPYGPWRPVETPERKEIPLENGAAAAPSVMHVHKDETDEDLQFGERKVKLAPKAGEGAVEFKKRKVLAATRRRRNTED
uniref:Matrin-type domain-containing protein n=1 Tax=Trichuris muris TaxID=70415 RepID=A0A5S6QC12_TRIMR